ncbi:MAG: hypothetical protein C0622_04790 [Desulfuromonas sp.]|nr:MAG: hypothetical protein C0622_04790 [Desulfuromonas sp.]
MLLRVTYLLFALLLSLSACAPVSQVEDQPVTSHAQVNPQQAEVHYKLALAYLKGNDPTSALKELQIAASQDPNNAAIQIALGQTYQQKKAYRLAERHYLRALTLSNDDPRYQNNIASLYLDLQEWDKAIEYFDKAAQNLLFHNPHVALSGEAFAYYKKGDYEKALELYREVLALVPRYVPAYYYQSEVYRALKQPAAEKATLLRAVDISPSFLQARYRLAEILYEEDDIEGVREQLKVILDMSPTSDLGMKANDFMRQLPGS